MPCYVVKDTDAPEEGPKVRLVEANNQAAARNFVTRSRFEVKQAEPKEIAEMVKAGVAYEVATGDAQVQEELLTQEAPPKDKFDMEELPSTVAEEQKPKK